MKKQANLFFCLSLPFLFSYAILALNSHVEKPVETFKITAFEIRNNEKIPKVATLGPEVLTRTGSGIRQKRIFFMSVDAYRATMFVTDAAKFPRKVEGTVALDSLLTMPSVAMVLDFKQNVSASKILDCFETAFKKNGIKDSQPLARLKIAIKDAGTIAKGQRVSIFATRGKLTLELGKKSVEIMGDSKFVRDVFSPWLGLPTDNELKTLKQALILGN